MEITRLADLKPRTVWEITDDAFDLYRERFALLSGVSAVVFAPTFLLLSTAGVAAWKQWAAISSGPETAKSAALNLAWLLPLLAGAYVLHFGATALGVRDLLSGETPSLVGVYRRALHRFFPLLLAALAIGLLALVSFCTYVGPPLVLAYHAFVSHGILLEDRKIGDSVKRSRAIAGAYFGKSFGLLCLMGFIGLALVVGAVAVVSLGFEFLPKEAGATPTGGRSMEDILQTLTVSLMVVLIAPLPAIATTLLYYDLRVRREGLDLESEAEAWGVTLAPDPFAGILNPKTPKVPKQKGAKK